MMDDMGKYFYNFILCRFSISNGLPREKKISRNNDDRVVEKSCWQRVGCGKGHPAIYCAAVYILHLKKEEIYQ